MSKGDNGLKGYGPLYAHSCLSVSWSLSPQETWIPRSLTCLGAWLATHHFPFNLAESRNSFFIFLSEVPYLWITDFSFELESQNQLSHGVKSLYAIKKKLVLESCICESMWVLSSHIWMQCLQWGHQTCRGQPSESLGLKTVVFFSWEPTQRCGCCFEIQIERQVWEVV